MKLFVFLALALSNFSLGRCQYQWSYNNPQQFYQPQQIAQQFSPYGYPSYNYPSYNAPSYNYPSYRRNDGPVWGSQPQPSLRISASKCEVYKKLTLKVVNFGGLTLQPTSTQQHVSETCDISAGLIVGGIKANSGEFPHMAALGYPDDDTNGIVFACGGSLINERFVLTAAHCHKRLRIAPTIVLLGATNLEHDGINVTIQEFIKHSDYSSQTKANDIAVVKMTRSVTFSKTLRPACLQQTRVISETTTVASGWGTTRFAGSGTTDLMKVKLDILDNSKCVEQYKDEEDDIDVTDNQICAGVLTGGKDTCQGDSGGPLQIVKSDNKCMAYIIGITSFGGYCGGQNSPSVYTRVSAYLDWIEANAFN